MLYVSKIHDSDDLDIINTYDKSTTTVTVDEALKMQSKGISIAGFDYPDFKELSECEAMLQYDGDRVGDTLIDCVFVASTRYEGRGMYYMLNRNCFNNSSVCRLKGTYGILKGSACVLRARDNSFWMRFDNGYDSGYFNNKKVRVLFIGAVPDRMNTDSIVNRLRATDKKSVTGEKIDESFVEIELVQVLSLSNDEKYSIPLINGYRYESLKFILLHVETASDASALHVDGETVECTEESLLTCSEYELRNYSTYYMNSDNKLSCYFTDKSIIWSGLDGKYTLDLRIIRDRNVLSLSKLELRKYAAAKLMHQGYCPLSVDNICRIIFVSKGDELLIPDGCVGISVSMEEFIKIDCLLSYIYLPKEFEFIEYNKLSLLDLLRKYISEDTVVAYNAKTFKFIEAWRLKKFDFVRGGLFEPYLYYGRAVASSSLNSFNDYVMSSLKEQIDSIDSNKLQREVLEILNFANGLSSKMSIIGKDLSRKDVFTLKAALDIADAVKTKVSGNEFNKLYSILNCVYENIMDSGQIL